jgi:hypothetical protein
MSTLELRAFGTREQKLDEAFLEQVLRAVLECYVMEKGVPPRVIEARELRQLRSVITRLCRLFHSEFPCLPDVIETAVLGDRLDTGLLASSW